MKQTLIESALQAGEMALHSISIKITRYFTDVDGAIVAKAAVPAALQIPFPFFTWGKFDKDGGFRYGMSTLGIGDGAVYLTTFVNGCGYESANIVGFSGLNTVKGKLLQGDIVHVFTNDLQNPTYFIWIVQNCAAAALGSIVQNIGTTQQDGRLGRIKIKDLNYVADSIAQYGERIFIVNVDNIGRYRYDTINPLIWKTPLTFQSDLLLIGLGLTLDQYVGIYSNILFATDSITWAFRLTK